MLRRHLLVLPPDRLRLRPLQSLLRASRELGSHNLSPFLGLGLDDQHPSNQAAQKAESIPPDPSRQSPRRRDRPISSNYDRNLRAVKSEAKNPSNYKAFTVLRRPYP